MKSGSDLFLQRLFEKMADSYSGTCEMTEEGDGHIVVRLTDDRGRTAAHCRLSVWANSSGVGLIQVDDAEGEATYGPGTVRRGSEKDESWIVVSPVASAVLAVMLR